MVGEDSLSMGDVSTVVPMIRNGASSHTSQVYEENRRIVMKPKDRQYEKEGKRWVRRRENSCFVGNGYIVKPSAKDFALNLSLPRSTFPKPLPPFIARHPSAPSVSLPRRDPASANAGRYSLSLKGVRRELRRSGLGAEQIVLDIEQELMEWLETGGILISPDSRHVYSLSGTPGTPLGSSQSIIEVHRSPTELIWRIDKNFPRFLLHCVARFHGIVSFSKTTPGVERDMRLTYLLRPNVTRPDFTAPGVLDTPPASDTDAFSVTMMDTEDSDVASEFALGSEEGGFTRSILNSFNDLMPSEGHESQVHNPERQQLDDAESSEADHADNTSVESLEDDQDWEPTPITRHARTVSSPSCSPSHSARWSNCRTANPRHSARVRLPFWRYVFA